MWEKQRILFEASVSSWSVVKAAGDVEVEVGREWAFAFGLDCPYEADSGCREVVGCCEKNSV